MRYTQTQNEPEAAGGDPEDDGYSPPPALGAGSPSQADDGLQPRSSRPGQTGFAQRLMSKYGWTKGSGLGADESGIINPLRVQVEKRRKKADADGGGWAEPGSKGKIIGGKRKEENAGKFGTMSDVIVLRDMLENMPNLQEEIAGGLGQEIGEECGEKVCWYRLQTMLCVGTDGDGTVRTCGEIIHRPGEPQGLHQIHKPGFGTQSEFSSLT